MMATFEERYLSGAELYGDDFGPDQIEQWFADEVEGYASLGAAENDDASTYEYHSLNSRHGFSRLPSGCRFEHALGLGSAYGGEFLPIIDRCDAVTILEPSSQLTSAKLGHLAPAYRRPEASGDIPFDGATFDLVLSFGTLHHIPNVTKVLTEIGRVTKHGGYLLVREPMISMGDWRFQRKAGVTTRERGIPRELLLRQIRGAGFVIESAQPVGFPITPRIGKLIGRPAFNSPLLTFLDGALCRVTNFNYRYHALTKPQRVRPTSLFVAARREALAGT